MDRSGAVGSLSGDFELSDSDGMQVYIISAWRAKTQATRIQATKTANICTEPLENRSVTCQTTQQQNGSAQTDEYSAAETDFTYQAEDIERFLLRVEPRLLAALDQEDSFASVKCGEPVAEPAPMGSTRLLHVLDGIDDDPHDLVCTCLSWNSTGRTIAVAYGRNDLDGWCGIPGALATWNLAREGPKERPEARIDCDCCLTACSFHPQKPALIAGGTFNGDLYIWDTGADGDYQIGKSGISHVSHQDSISEIAWQSHPQAGARRGRKNQIYQILTLGVDGRLLMWSWSEAENPVFGFELSAVVPSGHGVALWGGSSMATPKGGNTAVVGTVAGQVFHCFLDHNEAMCKRFSEAAAANDAPELHWRSPIKDTEFEPHAGPVCGVDCSPFQRDLFLSCGADGTIHMYSLLKGHSILSLEPTSHGLSCVKWSPVRPLVFAVATGDGRLLFYDLVRSSFHPVDSLDASEVCSPVNCISFNKKFGSWFATAQGSTAKIWELGQHLTIEQSIEPSIIQFISEAASAGQMGTNIFQQIQCR